MDFPTDRPRSLALIQAGHQFASILGGPWVERLGHAEVDHGDMDNGELADILTEYVADLVAGAANGARLRLAALLAEAAAELVERA